MSFQVRTAELSNLQAVDSHVAHPLASQIHGSGFSGILTENAFSLHSTSNAILTSQQLHLPCL